MSIISPRQSVTHALLAATKNLLLPEGAGSALAALDTVLGSPADQLVINQGLIATTAPDTAAIDIPGYGIVLNTGTVSASATTSDGIRIGRVGVVINAGLVAGGHDGIDLAAGGLVINLAGGRIDAGVGDGINVSGTSCTIVNAGTIGGGNGVGNVPTGDYSLEGDGGGSGIVLQSNGALTNSGIIFGGSGGSADGSNVSGRGGAGGAGMALQTGRLTNSGTIQGGTGGSTRNYGPSGYGGAGGSAVILHSSGVLTNTGLLVGGGGGSARSGGNATGGGGGVGISVYSVGSVENSGIVLGGGGGYAYGYVGVGGSGGGGIVMQAGGMVANSGDVAGGAADREYGYELAFGGNGGAGIAEQAAGTVINSGTITGGNGSFGFSGSGANAPGITLASGGVVINAAGGLIQGAAYGSNGIDVSGGAGTITDAGTISGTDAIAFSGSFADRVVLDPGAVLIGAVIGGSGTNTLELASGNTGTVSSFGTEFSSFGTIVLDSGSHWLLDGAGPTTAQGITLSGTGTVLALNDANDVKDPISGFVKSDALDLRDLAYSANAVTSLIGNTLTVTSDGVSDTLTVLGLPDSTKFELSDDGSGHLLVGNGGPGTDFSSALKAAFLTGPAAVTTHGATDAGAAAFAGKSSATVAAAALVSHQALQTLMQGSLDQRFAPATVSVVVGAVTANTTTHDAMTSLLRPSVIAAGGSSSTMHFSVIHHVA